MVDENGSTFISDESLKSISPLKLNSPSLIPDSTHDADHLLHEFLFYRLNRVLIQGGAEKLSGCIMQGFPVTS